jgi:hypothetical protein
MEGDTFAGLCDRFPNKLDPDALNNWELVCRLQSAHDRAANLLPHFPFVEDYEAHMASIAKSEGLTYTPPQAA